MILITQAFEGRGRQNGILWQWDSRQQELGSFLKNDVIGWVKFNNKGDVCAELIGRLEEQLMLVCTARKTRFIILFWLRPENTKIWNTSPSNDEPSGSNSRFFNGSTPLYKAFSLSHKSYQQIQHSKVENS